MDRRCSTRSPRPSPKLDFLVHAIGFAERSQISGSFVDNADRGAFLRAMDISVFSFVESAKCASHDDGARRLDRRP